MLMKRSECDHLVNEIKPFKYVILLYRLTVGSEVAERDIVQFVPFKDYVHVSWICKLGCCGSKLYFSVFTSTPGKYSSG